MDLHYITMMSSGLNLFVLLWMLLRYSRFRSKGIPALRYCLSIQLGGVVFGLVTTLALLLPPGPALEVCALIMAASSLIVNSFFALMVFNFSFGEESVFVRYQRVFVWIVVALMPLYATNGWHHLILQDIIKNPDGFGFHLVYGLGSIVILVYSYLLSTVAVFSIFKLRKGGVLQKTWLRVAVLGSALIQAVATALEQLFPILHELQLSLFINWIPVSIICYLFFGFLLTGRKTALDVVDDVYVAFDLNNYCVDVNRKGIEFFMRHCGTEQPTIGDVRRLLEAEDLAQYTGGEICINDDAGNCYYQVSTFQLSSGINQHCGNGYIIREITEFIDRMEEINAIAVQDSLTGAMKRRYLEMKAPSILASAHRGGVPVTVMMLDIDHFKNVNDTYGHPIGDEVLIKLREILRANLRENDVVVRYGGEEFLTMCVGLTYERGCQIAERIRANIEQAPFVTSGGVLPITVSIGVCSSFPSADDHIDMYIEKADERLYNAKNSGRNKVC